MRALAVASLLLFPLFAGLASAHEPDTFTVIVREDRHDPMEVNLIVNDTVQYVNVDSRENITHHIGLDLNGDNDFDDEGEFSSGILNSTCDWDNESVCRVAWILHANNTELIGSYVLSDLMSDGNETEITLNIGPDNHGGIGPNVGECFGAGCEEEKDAQSEESNRSTLQNVLILGGLLMLLIAFSLSISMLSDYRAAEGGHEGEQESLGR